MQPSAIVPLLLPAHILAGALALIFGYLALYASKGATLHRKSGLLFVIAMMTMSLSGASIAFLNASSISVVAGLLTFYFVTTGLLTVRPRMQHSDLIDRVAMMFALTVAALGFYTGYALLDSKRPEMVPMFIFGGVGVLAAIGDLRMIRARAVDGAFDSAQGKRRRLSRHLWRMCFAMWVAAASFFWGPPDRVPEVIRIPALQAVAVLVPIFAMLYWLWRLRGKKTSRSKTLLARGELAITRQT
jgi:uncharacterized membrane protein